MNEERIAVTIGQIEQQLNRIAVVLEAFLRLAAEATEQETESR